MKVGYLGPKGTFTEEAARILAKGNELIPYHSFFDALKAVADDEIDEAVVAFENSIEGVVNMTIDSLAFDVDLYIQELLIMPIEQCLIAKKGTDISSIKKIMSHSHAIPQCKNFINANLSKAESETKASTAGAIKAVAEGEDNIAGIGARCAAELYGLEVIAEGIQDTNDNFTEFARVSKNKSLNYINGNKVTICFSTVDEPGALLKLLDIFSIYDINMSKIFSRPMRNKPLEYIFIIDLDVNNNSDDFKAAIKLLERKTAFCKNLGCYSVVDKRLKK
ncbi:MAG: prephenate dehydratase [Clostridia bacterium]|nr:prephenate dehydratase [Clostridia bacterium]